MSKSLPILRYDRQFPFRWIFVSIRSNEIIVQFIEIFPKNYDLKNVEVYP